MAKLINEKEAAALIKDGQTVAVGGFGAFAGPELLLKAVEDSFNECGHPKNLTLACFVGPANNTEENVGLNRLAKPGLLKTVIGAHLAFAKRIGKMISDDEIEAYMIPLGSAVHMFRAKGASADAYVTDIGLGTYADPRFEGCRVNEKAKREGKEIVSLITVNGKECLEYKTFPVDICLIRGTYADEDGNISMEEELVGDYCLQMAAATHASGGKVIVQVKDVVKSKSLDSRAVRIHKSLIDYVVKCQDPEYHKPCLVQEDLEAFIDGLSAESRGSRRMQMGNRKIIARRAVQCLKKGMLINLGIGIPSGVGIIADEEGLTPYLTHSLETGPVGGIPVEGVAFGASVNPDIVYPVDQIFDLYDGGVLDITCLGAAEIDSFGNVNVSKFGTCCTGPGGFVNISQRTPLVCFMGTFTAGGLKEEVVDGKLVIVQEGRVKKFKNRVQQITYSSKYTEKTGQEVLYITERAVFVHTKDGIMLTEIAPGADLQKDILDQMEFTPLISDNLKLMDENIFKDEPMGYLKEFLGE